MMMPGIEELRDKLTEHAALFRAVVTAPRISTAEVRRIDARPVTIRNESMVQITRRIGAQDFHSNVLPTEAINTLIEAMPQYRQGIFDIPGMRIHALTNKRGQVALRYMTGKKEVTHEQHDQRRARIIQNPGWMRSLGLVNAEGMTAPGMGDKQRQIDHFLRILRDAVSGIKEPYEIIDLCCGKGYLTFAAASVLPDIKITGMDLKRDVINNLNAITSAEGMNNLTFLHGDINNFSKPELKPVVISLHACDTATDIVLAKAIKWHAPAILCAPCCQHELNNQVDNDLLRPLLKHKLLKERYAALLTDALRASLLEGNGYRLDAVEFTDSEHTPKNLMLRAVYTGNRASLDGYKALRDAMCVKPSLEEMLSTDDGGY